MAKQTFPTFMGIELGDYVGDIKVPGVEADAVVAAQKKNLDALTQVNRLAFEGAQAVMKRQAEILRQAIEETAAMISEMSAVPVSPAERMAKQTDVTKDLFGKILANVKELSEMVSQSNSEVMDLLNTRFIQSLAELKSAIERTPAVTLPAPVAEAATAATPAVKPAPKGSGRGTASKAAARAE